MSKLPASLESPLACAIRNYGSPRKNVFCIKQMCLRIQRACFNISGTYDAESCMQAPISLRKCGTMARSNTVLVAGVLDMAETLEGFAQRLRRRVCKEKYVQHDVGVQHPKRAQCCLGGCGWLAQLRARGVG